MFGPRMIVGVIKLTGIRRMPFRGIIVDLIILLEVENCLAVKSVRCRICKCFFYIIDMVVTISICFS